MGRIIKDTFDAIPRHLETDSLHHEGLVATPEDVAEILDYVKKNPERRACEHVFDEAAHELPGFKSDADVHSYHGYRFLLGLRNYSDPYAQTLRMLDGLGISTAPRLTDLIGLEGDRSLLVSCYRGCETSDVLPCKGAHFKFSSDAKEAALRDARVLIENELVNPWALKGLAYWHYSPSSGALYLDGWVGLRRAHGREKTHYIEDVAAVLDKLPT